jgi:hypothetical protein
MSEVSMREPTDPAPFLTSRLALILVCRLRKRVHLLGQPPPVAQWCTVYRMRVPRHTEIGAAGFGARVLADERRLVELRVLFGAAAANAPSPE